MSILLSKSDDTRPGKKETTPEKQAATDGENACRCKDASEMTPRQLLGLMFSDLAFWKKPKKM
jgi:hypothetical protein